MDQIDELIQAAKREFDAGVRLERDGLVLDAQLKYEAARSVFARVRAEFAEPVIAELEAQIFGGLARVASALGEPPAEHLRASLDIWEQLVKSTPGLETSSPFVVALVSIARSSFSLGDVELARRAGRLLPDFASVDFGAHRDGITVGLAAMTAASVASDIWWEQGDTDRALMLLEECLHLHSTVTTVAIDDVQSVSLLSRLVIYQAKYLKRSLLTGRSPGSRRVMHAEFMDNCDRVYALAEATNDLNLAVQTILEAATGVSIADACSMPAVEAHAWAQRVRRWVEEQSEQGNTGALVVAGDIDALLAPFDS